MFSLHVQSCMHLKLAIDLCLYLCFCLFSFCSFLLFATGECLAWDLGSRSYSCRLGSSYPNKVVKYKI